MVHLLRSFPKFEFGESMNWSRTEILDFTGFSEKSSPQFSEAITKLLRAPEKGKEKLLIVLDIAYGLLASAPAVVRDHINLSGNNPLVGPNNPIGERFTVVNNVYVTNNLLSLHFPSLQNLSSVVVAGLKKNQLINAQDLDFIRQLGADCYCYNLVPTMLIAAHAGWQVLALVGPAEKNWQQETLAKLNYNFSHLGQ